MQLHIRKWHNTKTQLPAPPDLRLSVFEPIMMVSSPQLYSEFETVGLQLPGVQKKNPSQIKHRQANLT